MKLGGQEVLEDRVVKKKARTTCLGTPHYMVNGEVRCFLIRLKADHKWIIGEQALV